MDQREKTAGFEEMLRIAIEGLAKNLMTAMPVEVVSWDASEMTVTAQPLLAVRVQKPDGSWVDVQMPPLIHAPVVFPGGGGFSLTSPPKAGDEAVAIFSYRSIDEWWLAGGIQKRADYRTHNLSDAFVFVGLRSKPHVLAGINPLGMEMRSDDGSTAVAVETGGIVAVKAPGGMAVTGGASVSGALAVGGQIQAASLDLTTNPTPSSTASTASVPVTLNGVVWYLRLSPTP